jgi:hypothetical protein
LDDDFRANSDIPADFTQEEISQLRKEYAEDMATDKKFIFGKYTVTDKGVVRISSFLVSAVNQVSVTGSKNATVSKQPPSADISALVQTYQGCEA